MMLLTSVTIARKKWETIIFVVSPRFVLPAKQRVGRDTNVARRTSALIARKRFPKTINTNNDLGNLTQGFLFKTS